MKEYIIGQYYPYLIIGVYDIDLKIPENLFESEVEDQIGKKCEEWYEELKVKLNNKFKEKLNLTEVVSYSFKKFSSRDLIEMPYKVESSLCVPTLLNQKSSDSKVAEFNVMLEVDEEIEKNVLDYLLENNYYFKENEDGEISSFAMLGE